MFYGKTSGDGPGGPGGAGRGNRNERYDQMVRQQQLIEEKKKEIQARLEAERQKKAIEAASKPKSSSSASTSSASPSLSSASSSSQRRGESNNADIEEKKPSVIIPNAFSNDGSFLEQFKRMQEEAMKKKKEEEEKAALKNIKEEPIEYDEYGTPLKGHSKPFIKVIHPDPCGRSSSPYNRNESSASSHQSYYNVPPPPPPPPPGMPPQKKEMKPYFGLGSGGFQNVPPPPPPLPIPQGIPQKQFGGFPSPAVRALASVVAEGGDRVEEELKMKHQGDPLMWFLFKPDSAEYRTFRALVAEIQSDNRTHMYNQAPPPPPPGVKIEHIKAEPKIPDYSNRFVSESVKPLKREASSSDDEETEKERRERKRRSRWGPQAKEGDVPPIGVAVPSVPGLSAPGVIPEMKIAIPSPETSAGINLMSMPLMAVQSTPGPGTLSKVSRATPQLIAYAKQAYGRTDLDEDEWKQCEEAYKMNLVFQDIARKKAKDEELERAGKFKHEYDSDEEVDGGTWEHKQRMKEMDKTKDWADELTKKAKGKHHIGDFLPPAELEKFMEKYKAVKEGKRLDESEYQEYKIQQDNIGFKMLQKMGWSSGEGLGAAGQGITAPIEKGNAPGDKLGLGTEQPGDLTEDDDEYAAYRKRMMLAYRFRPNPLNNPRRAYY